MIYSAVASRYAIALYNVSKVYNKTEDYKLALSALNQIYDSISSFVNNQAVKPHARVKFLTDILEQFGLHVDENFRRFLLLLIQNKRFKNLKQIASYFDYVLLEEQGLIPVDLVAAAQLSEEEETAVEEFVRRHTGRRPLFKKVIDDRLIAGVVLEFAGKKFDASVRGRLTEMARLLRKG